MYVGHLQRQSGAEVANLAEAAGCRQRCAVFMKEMQLAGLKDYLGPSGSHRACKASAASKASGASNTRKSGFVFLK